MSVSHPSFKYLSLGVFLLACLVIGAKASVFAQELEPIPSQQSAKPINTAPASVPYEKGSDGRFVLKGSIQTIDAAIQAEKDTVDWYAWYLSARQYLTRMGGLKCPAGSMITFHKNGHIEAESSHPLCMMSIQGLRYPLPANTKLQAVQLPVRSGQAPPAPASEIYQRTKGFQ